MCAYRLRERCKDKVDAFIAGLTEIVPDELLGVFDESDLDVCATVLVVAVFHGRSDDHWWHVGDQCGGYEGSLQCDGRRHRLCKGG